MQEFQLNDDGICSLCNATSLEMEQVQCGICKKNFHGVCNACPGDLKWATKTTIQMFKASSTKRNFKFLCNCCLTTLETNMADIDGQRMHNMEQNMERINNELLEIKKLVTPKKESEAKNTMPHTTSKPTLSTCDNLWFNPERLATVKAKPPEAILVINKAADSVMDKTNMDMVENMVIERKIPVTKSFKNRNGNHIVMCDSVESRDALKIQVSEANNNIEMQTPKEKRPVISIVGLSKSYEKHEVVDLLVKQNNFVRQFSTVNNIKDHVNIFAVKPIRGKPSVHQAFA